ncbi:MAG: response regulator [Chloroflexota bacterium]|nr:response regulator [Chloroflexota bacterium]
MSKILIVDDEAFIRLLIEQTLEDLEDKNVQILSTDNGEDALKIIQDEKPQVVFLDIMIPRMSGYDVCKTIRLDLKMLDIYIVMLTAKGQEADKMLSEELGANLFITKPFDPDELLSIAEKVLDI